jgi:hypothetical protein
MGQNHEFKAMKVKDLRDGGDRKKATDQGHSCLGCGCLECWSNDQAFEACVV